MRLEEEIHTSKFVSEVQKAAINLLFTSHWLNTKINSYLKPFGFTHEQFNVMRILKGKHPEKMCVKNIGMRMIEKNSNVPRILDRLEKKGWIVRQQSVEDRRETETSLTSLGIEMLTKASENIAFHQSTMMKLDETMALELNTILEKIREI
jgi:DNA-binding MarR family transcriptional regulator